MEIVIYIAQVGCVFIISRYIKTTACFFGCVTFLLLPVFMYIEGNSIAQVGLISAVSILSGLGISYFVKKGEYVNNEGQNKTVYNPKPITTFRVPLPIRGLGSACIDNIRLGVSITGASGSGKSTSPTYAIAKYFAKEKYAGIIHDFKNFELVEILYPLFKQNNIPFYCISPTDLSRTSRFNPIAPKYISNEMRLNATINMFIDSLSGSTATSDASIYFNNGAASLIGAVIWRLKESFPEKCNLPYVISFILGANHDKKIQTPKGVAIQPLGRLADFISASPEARVIGSVFLKAMSNEREIGSLFGTVSANLRKLSSPELFYILSENEINLDVNSSTNRSVVAFINTPASEQSSISPILALGIESAFNAMSHQGRQPSFILLEEAPKIKLPSLGNRVTTLRSYGVSFTYIMQDVVQAKTQFHGQDYYVKEVLSNLSTQFFGKVNDPESGKYYQGFFPLIKEKTYSNSYGSDLFGNDNRRSVSEKEKRKVDMHDFTKLRAGEFYLVSGGKDKLIRFQDMSKNMEKELPPVIRELSEEELRSQYNQILREASTCFYSEFEHSHSDWEN